jgi:hypothetical protein
MLRSIALLTGGLAFAAGATPAIASAAPARGPALTTPSESLRAALTCEGKIAGARRDPVLLVHGTFGDGAINWGWNYQRVLPTRGRAACTVDLPGKGTGDAQLASEYVVHAIRSLRRRAVPDAQRLGLPASAQPRPRDDSRRRLHGGVDGGRQDLRDAGRGGAEGRAQHRRPAAVPGPRVDHVGVAFDGPTFAITMDALDHPGRAKPGRIDRAVCATDTMPGVSRPEADAKLAEYAGILDAALGPNGPRAEGEPPMACYVKPRRGRACH